MSKHHNSKMEVEDAIGAVPTTSSRGALKQDQTPYTNCDGGDVEIARLAYSYWEARGCTNGSADEDWVRAEQDMKARRL
jgi:DUF2934 family protein